MRDHHGVHAQHQAGCAGPFAVHHPAQQAAAAGAQRACQCDGATHAYFAQQVTANDGAADVHDGHGRQYPAQLQAGQMQDLDKHKRRGGEVDKQNAIAGE